MATGSLRLAVVDLLSAPIDGKLEIDFEPAANSPGGTVMEVNFAEAGETDFIVENLQCRGGPGTLYRVVITAKNFRTYSFFQLILDGRINTPSESPARLIVKPKHVKDIVAPAFSALDASLRAFLDAANMQAPKQEDRDLAGLQGEALYDLLGPLRKACLLNLFKKASHPSSDGCFVRECAHRTLSQDSVSPDSRNAIARCSSLARWVLSIEIDRRGAKRSGIAAVRTL